MITSTTAWEKICDVKPPREEEEPEETVERVTELGMGSMAWEDDGTL